ncbi:hypothetical protein [Bradyrhizobium sp. WSM471]|uniref:hypothetical protein n=1 Tax=Bradyrhizobium sp. WSM471 TaxID=319017 RepID=UPI0002F9C107|nr:MULTISPECIES: hypothetical protein [Bradyrhizobium]UFW43171.1 hypothetical protein BcanWSM471_08815 [Bradyrhizobium canariense]
MDKNERHCLLWFSEIIDPPRTPNRTARANGAARAFRCRCHGCNCIAAWNYASLIQRQSSASNQLKALVVSLSQSFLESGQIASDFRRRPTEMLIKRHADHHERQMETLSRLQTLVSALPDDSPLKQAVALQPIINLFATRFQNVVSAQRNLGFNEDDGFQGKLRKAVHAAEQQLAEANQPSLTILMLMMRRHEKDFILRGEDNGEKLTNLETEFETELAKASLPAEAKADILKLARAYKDNFVSFMVTQQTLTDQVSDLGQI